MNEFNFISPQRLFAKIEKQLSAYTSNALLDTGDFYAEIKWCVAQFGLASKEMKDAIVKLSDYKGELECDFYLLDSAWLCNPGGEGSVPMFQSKEIGYTETTSECVEGGLSCDQGGNTGMCIVDTCKTGEVFSKVTVREYINSQPQYYTYNYPTLLRLNNKKSVEKFFKDDCKNLFSNSPEEISIKKQGDSSFLYSTLKDPIIFYKYWAYPIDTSTKEPLIPDDPILERAIEYHLLYYFFKMMYLNGDNKDIQNKVLMLQQDASKYMGEAVNLCQLPSFNKMINTARRERSKWNSYNVMGRKHW